jgi:hypothetical protein
MPVCTKCGKESHNLHVCPFCFVEYPVLRTATGTLSAARLKAHVSRVTFVVSRRVRWAIVVTCAVFGAWYFFAGRERTIPTGIVTKDVVVAPMSRGEAEVLLRRVRQSGAVVQRGEELEVTFSTSLWPQQRAGQLAVAQQFAHAVEIVEGRRRAISFYTPDGSLFATANADGVVMVK